MRFNELIAGVRSDVAVKVYGDDFEAMRASAERDASVLRSIPGELVGLKANSVTSNQPTAMSDSSAASTSTNTEGTLAVEGVSPASVLATIDTSKLVTNAKANEEAKTKASASLKRRTTKELAQAELEAVKTR